MIKVIQGELKEMLKYVKQIGWWNLYLRSIALGAGLSTYQDIMKVDNINYYERFFLTADFTSDIQLYISSPLLAYFIFCGDFILYSIPFLTVILLFYLIFSKPKNAGG